MEEKLLNQTSWGENNSRVLLFLLPHQAHRRARRHHLISWPNFFFLSWMLPLWDGGQSLQRAFRKRPQRRDKTLKGCVPHSPRCCSRPWIQTLFPADRKEPHCCCRYAQTLPRRSKYFTLTGCSHSISSPDTQTQADTQWSSLIILLKISWVLVM